MSPHTGQMTLRQLRSELKSRGFVAELLPVQQAILAAEKAAGCMDGVAKAYNYLSVIFLRLGQPVDAEAAARAALSAHAEVNTQRAEAVGCFQCVLARALAAQGRFAEAVEAAEAGCREYAVLHSPPDEFLSDRLAELALLRRGEMPVPLEW